MRLARVEDTRNFASSTMVEIIVGDMENIKLQMESVLDIVESGIDEFDQIYERINSLEYRVDLNEEACRTKAWCEKFYDD